MSDKIKKYLCWLLIPAAILWGCELKTENNNIIVAEVGSKKLLSSEVAAVIPSNLEKEDSIAMAGDYIRKWVGQELMLQKAEENLSAELKNVSRELEEYRKSMIIFRYKNELMAQRMDTLVTQSEIMDYYAQNSDNFRLSKTIVKAVYFKVPLEFANPEMLKDLTCDTSETGSGEIRDYGVQYAKSHGVYIDRWVELDAVMQNFPVGVENPGRYLSSNKFVEYSDSSYYYLMTIRDYILKNEQAPVEYVENNIKSLILNQRKIVFLKNLENNIYREGDNKNKFKIYNLETDETE